LENSGVRKANRGAALLAVLWLAAGLSAIALTIANTVRGETERSSTEADGLKAYYLAAGAIDRMLLYLEKAGSFRKPDKTAMIQEFTRVLALDFPTGVVIGEIIP
jgi:type II secretory pathway component PulK